MNIISEVVPVQAVQSCCQDYVHVADIKGDIIVTEDGRYVRIVEVSPINLPMKNADEQSIVFSRYRAWLKSAPSSFTVKCITKSTPIDGYRRAFREAMEKEQSEKVKAYTNKHIRFAESLGMMQSSETKTYLIFEYNGEDDYYNSSTEEDKMRFLKQEEATLSQELNAIGNTVITRESEEEELKFITKFLYDYYNRRLQNKAPLETRIRRYVNDAKIARNIYGADEEPSFRIKDIVAPISVSDKESPEYLIVDGLYCSFFCIDSDGYPDYMDAPSGWLTALINFGYGYEVDIHFEKKDVQKVLKEIKTKSRFNRMKMRDRDSSSSDREEIEDSLDSMASIREAIKRGGEDFYDMSVMIGVYAYSKEELARKIGSLNRFCKRQEITLNNLWGKQKQGFISMAPLNEVTPRIGHIANRGVPTNVVAATYPYSSFSLNDKDGVLLGLHQNNNSLVIFNPFDTKKYANPNAIVLAEPGRGKTFTLSALATRFRYLGTQVFILSPDKQDEFRRTCEAMDGIFVDVSASARSRINPFDIWVIESESKEILNNTSGETSWLTDKLDSLGTWLSMLIPGLGQRDKNVLKRCLSRMYSGKGITRDNSSIFQDKEHKHKKEMPTYSDFVKELREDPEVNPDHIALFEQFSEDDGIYKALDGQTNVDLTNKFIVFGLEYLSKELQAPTMFIVLQFIWAVTKSDKLQKKSIIIDEGSVLVDGKNQQVGEFVVEVFRMSRAYSCSSIFATQTITDLYKHDGEFGNVILSCAHTKILLGMSSTDLRFVKNELELTPSEEATIRDFHKNGEAMLCAGASHIPINVKVSQDEFDMFTTDRAQLERIVNERRNGRAE